ncbi:MAG: CPBP family intramembrane metalloprotease [Pseudobutyrivibrio sp.]|nr:CPBP family intramembrane metalloprotease [Pseudobutyrivibrio sp.]
MKKSLTFVQALLPFIVMAAIQLIFGIVTGIVVCTQLVMEQPDLINNPTLYQEVLTAQVSEVMPNTIMIIHITNVIIMLIWFIRFNKKNNTPGTSYVKSATLKNIGMVVLIAIGLQGVITFGLCLISYFNPELFTAYNELLEQSGLTSASTPALLSATVLAPIGEELAFRGITMRYLKKTGLCIWVANIIQAVLFGVEHLNIVQGIYATIMGLVFGYIMYKYDSIYLAILLHILVNTMSYVFGMLPLDMERLPHIFVMGIIGIAFSVAAAYATITNPAEVPVEASEDATECA